MPIDVSDSIFRDLQAAEQKARSLEHGKDFLAAAKQWRLCHHHMTQYAKQPGVGDMVQRMRLERAEKYLTQAGQADVRAQQGGSSVSEVPESKDYRSTIESLIAQMDVAWADIGGLEQTKEGIQANYALSLVLHPDGVEIRTNRNLLPLFGTPGTGKSTLAMEFGRRKFFEVDIQQRLNATVQESGLTFNRVQIQDLYLRYDDLTKREEKATYRVRRALIWQNIWEMAKWDCIHKVETEQQWQDFRAAVDKDSLLREGELQKLRDALRWETDDRRQARAHLIAMSQVQTDYELRAARLNEQFRHDQARLLNELELAELDTIGRLELEQKRVVIQLDLQARQDDFCRMQNGADDLAVRQALMEQTLVQRKKAFEQTQGIWERKCVEIEIARMEDDNNLLTAAKAQAMMRENRAQKLLIEFEDAQRHQMADLEAEDARRRLDLGGLGWSQVNWNSVNWNSVNWNSVKWNIESYKAIPALHRSSENQRNIQLSAQWWSDSRYQIKRKLSQGGLCDVYLAEDKKLGKQIAIKVSHSGTNLSFEYDRQFIEEACVPARLKREYVVAIHDVITSGEQACFAMTYLLSVTDANGHTWGYEYDSQGNLTKVTDPLGNQTRYTYDASGRQTGVVDANGHTVAFVYDDANRLIRQTDAEGHITQFSYDGVGNRTSTTDGRGYARTFTYDTLNRRISQTDPLGGVASYAYDALGQQIRTTDENGVVIRSDYDALGRMVAEVRNEKPGQSADQQTNVTFTYAYDSVGNRIAQTDANGNQTSYVYSLLDCLTQQTDAENQVTGYLYDAVGNLVKFTNPRGFHTNFGYNADDQVVSVTDALSQVWGFQYAAAHNRATVIDPNGNVTLYHYDGLHRPLKEEDALGGITRFAYDGVGNRLMMEGANGHATTHVFDDLNRQTAMPAPDGQTLGYTYDAVGNQTLFTNGVIIFQMMTQHDSLRRPIRVIDAEDGEITAIYDGMGNRTDIIENDGVVTQYDYDPIYRLAGMTLNSILAALPSQETNVLFDYIYDPNGNLLAISDPLVYITQFDYDSLDRLVQEANPLGNVWQYTYDPVNNLTSGLDVNGDLTQYTYTADDLLQRIIYPDSTSMYTYNGANHNRTQMVDSIGTATWSYDELDRMATTTDSLGQVLAYALENDWLKTVTYDYQYDPLRRLPQVNDSEGVWTEYDFDAAGNCINNLFLSPQESLILGTDYTYDYENRLTQALDYQGNVQSHRVDVAVTDMLYDGVGRRLVMTYDSKAGASGSKRTEYVFDGPNPVAGVWIQQDAYRWRLMMPATL